MILVINIAYAQIVILIQSSPLGAGFFICLQCEVGKTCEFVTFPLVSWVRCGT